MRNKLADVLNKKGQKDKKIVVVVADISPSGKLSEFQKKNKNRFINVGVAEQFMIGFASGLAIAKYKPFVYTIAPFTIYRPFEMVRNDLSYQNLPVTIVAMGAGTVYSSLGGTHLTQEDISLMRSLPNMKILAPCDPIELEDCINYCIKNKNGPIYLRIGKSGEKELIDRNSEKWKFGKIRKLKNGNKICLLSYGPITKLSFNLSSQFKNIISVYSCHTIKPFDYQGLSRIMKKYKTIITLEDHSIIGGLGSIIKEQAFLNKYKGKIINFALKDKFIHNYGSHDNLLKSHGISQNILRKKIKELL